MNEDFVPFELSVKLKEKGFREKCLATFDNNGLFSLNYEDAHSNIDLKDLLYSHNSSASNIWVDAPTISQVLKWLREEKKIAVNVEFIPYTWQYKIIDTSFNNRFDSYGVIIFDSYEQAVLAGIEYVLDNLI